MTSKVSIQRNSIQARFGGMGFHNSEAGMFDLVTQSHFDHVLGKIYRDLAPGFSRTIGAAPEDTREKLDAFADYYDKMQRQTGTTMYLTGHTRPRVTAEDKAQYAKEVADRLEYLYHEKDMKNIRFYCMSNELSVDGQPWGTLYWTLGEHKAYHTALFREFQKRDLPIGLMSTDASPYERWQSLGWAAREMDDIIDIYGAHHYANEFDPEDLDFYGWFLKKVRGAVNTAASREKRFVLGEFGLRQCYPIHGVRKDVCTYFFDGQEAYAGLQISEMSLAAMNAGAYAMAFWTFCDYPTPTDPYKGYNKWGLTRWDGEDHSARDWLYCYGLMTKYFKKESKPLKVSTDDFKLRCGGTVNDDGSISVAIVNRHHEERDIVLELGDGVPRRPLRKYVYDSHDVPRSPFGDLQPVQDELDTRGGLVMMRVPADSVTLVTSDFVDRKPDAVQNVQWDCQTGKITWDPIDDPDHRYYRVHRYVDLRYNLGFYPDRSNQIASTVGLSCFDPEPHPSVIYKVLSVDCHGNTRE